MRHLDPRAAHALLHENPQAVLVDCRTEIEHMYVGHPVGAEHVAWQDAPDWEIDPEFPDKVKRLVRFDLNRTVALPQASPAPSPGWAWAPSSTRALVVAR